MDVAAERSHGETDPMVSEVAIWFWSGLITLGVCATFLGALYGLLCWHQRTQDVLTQPHRRRPL